MTAMIPATGEVMNPGALTISRREAEDAQAADLDNRLSLRRVSGYPAPAWDQGGREVRADRIHQRLNNVEMSFIELGRELAGAKADCPHGEWAAFLEDFGISASMCSLSIRWAERATSDKRLQLVGPAKARALMAMSKGDFDALIEDGQRGDVKLDEIERLTVRELREKVRKLETDRRKGKAQVADLRETVDQLDAQLNDRASKSEIEGAAPFNSAFARGMKALAQFEAALDCAPDPETATRCWAALNTHLGAMAQRRADQIKPGLIVAAQGARA